MTHDHGFRARVAHHAVHVDHHFHAFTLGGRGFDFNFGTAGPSGKQQQGGNLTHT